MIIIQIFFYNLPKKNIDNLCDPKKIYSKKKTYPAVIKKKQITSQHWLLTMVLDL
jgi:hypothetical protein